MCSEINVQYVSGTAWADNPIVDDFGTLREWLRTSLTMTIPMTQNIYDSNDYADDVCLCDVDIPKLGTMFRFVTVRTYDMGYVFFKTLDRAMIWMEEAKNKDMVWGFWTEFGVWFERVDRKDVKNP